MAYILRPFTDTDAPRLAELTLAAIRAVGSRHYTPEQVEAWAARHPRPERFVERAAEGHAIIVAADAANEAVAYALLEPAQGNEAHLDMLYCHPDHTRRGLANELLASCEQLALGKGITRLFTEASELARPAFERAGYTVQHRRDFDIAHGGNIVPIHNYAMEKLLDR